MGSFVVGFILLVIVALAVKSAVHRIRHGSACCGERDAPEKKIKPADKNKSHYPYEYILVVDGMRCSNCRCQSLWYSTTDEPSSLKRRC